MSREYLLLAAAIVLFAAETLESRVVRREAIHIFSPKLGWRCFFFVAIGLNLFEVMYLLPPSHRTLNRMPLWWPLLFLGLLLFARPKTIVVSATGLVSYGGYGLRRRFILWPEVLAVTSDWEEQRLTLNLTALLWVFTGFNLEVTGSDRTRIVHTILLRNQPRFLEDLRQHVPANAFAPGLYEWQPSR